MPDSGIIYRPSAAEWRGGNFNAGLMRTQKSTGKQVYGAPAPKIFTRPNLTKGTVYERQDFNPETRRRAPYARTDEERADEIRTWAHRDIQMWEPRNTRFRRDQDAFNLVHPDTNARDNKEAVILPDPRILVKKLARLIARHPAVIEVNPAPGVKDTSISQRIENLIYMIDQSVNQHWMQGLNNPFRYDQAQSLLLRGWLAERTLWYPGGKDQMDDDPAALWDHQVIDPALVYPYVAGNKIVRITHAYASTIGEMYFDPILYGKDHPQVWDEMEPNTLIECVAVYWMDRDGTWWHAVLATPYASGSRNNSEFLKKPTEIGYNPWTIMTANGITHRATPWEQTEYIQGIGTGILDESIDTFKYMNRMATKLNELLSVEANPPAAIYLENGQLKQISLAPGARNFFTNSSDKIELLRTGPRGDTYQALWDIIERRAERAGMPRAFYSEAGNESPFAAAALMAAGRDILFPFVEALNSSDAARHKKMLEQYRDFGPSKKMRSYMDSDDGKSITSAEVSAKDIKDQGTNVIVSREDMTPQELGARINLGLAQLARDAISMETFRKEYAKLKNPRAENRKILGEKVYMSEDVIKALIPVALEEEGLPGLRKLWEQTQNPTPPEAALPQPGQIGAQTPPMMGNQPGMPAMPPMLPGGIPPQINNQLDPMTALMQDPALMAMLTGGAQGGMGMGGLPPIPGMTPAPPITPSFRPA